MAGFREGMLRFSEADSPATLWRTGFREDLRRFFAGRGQAALGAPGFREEMLRFSHSSPSHAVARREFCTFRNTLSGKANRRPQEFRDDLLRFSLLPGARLAVGRSFARRGEAGCQGARASRHRRTTMAGRPRSLF